MTSLGSLDDMPETISLRSYRSYDVSEPLSELTSESYKYSVSDVPSGINLESVKSTSPPSAIDFLRDLKKKVLEPREPFREIIQGGSIKLISEEKPSTLDMSMIDQPADNKQYEQMSISERIQEEENKIKRGRKAGGKNRPKEEIQADKEEKLEKRKERIAKNEEKNKEVIRTAWSKVGGEWIKQLDEIDVQLAEIESRPRTSRMIDERDISNLKEI
jgi:hypothetical protein